MLCLESLFLLSEVNSAAFMFHHVPHWLSSASTGPLHPHPHWLVRTNTRPPSYARARRLRREVAPIHCWVTRTPDRSTSARHRRARWPSMPQNGWSHKIHNGRSESVDPRSDFLGVVEKGRCKSMYGDWWGILIHGRPGFTTAMWVNMPYAFDGV